ncbi:putative late blight resistance protein homolog R1B-17 [Lycium barbarum]|uniref:putative late blight resistance protein homolog R1B-17 n=1 Tax=Lycium barbarum TaxID=112863 RepID=UPI00293EED1B|nr:putative late blight resistance protein homolog R1B-17 [Lycium barbarum]
MSFFSYDADPLRCLQWLEQNNGSLTQLGRQLKIELKWLKIFLHWSTKCNSSFEDLKDLFKDVEAEVHYARNELHSLCYRVSPPINESLGSVIFDIISRIEPFKLQVKEAFMSVSQCLLQPEDDLSLEFIDSVVEFLEDLLCYYDDKLIVPEVKEQMESLQYKLRFSRDFLRLTQKECTDLEKWKSLLMHSENLAAKTAGVSLLDEDLDKERSLSMKLEVYDLSRDVIPIKQELAGVYTVLLKGLMTQKPRTCSMDEFVVGFVDFLLKNIVEVQKECEVGGLETLHEELRLLVYFLSDPPKEYVEEEKVNEYLIQIEAAIHEVASASYTFDIKETNDDLLRKIEFITREVKEFYQRVPRSSRYASPRTNGLGFIDLLLGNLNELLTVKADLIAPVKHQIEAISRDLEIMRSFLVDFSNDEYEQEKLKDLTDRVIDVAYKSEYVIDSFMVKSGPLWRYMLSDLEKDIKLVKLEIANTCATERFKESTPVVIASSTQDIVAMEEVVGFKDEAWEIIGRLTRGPVQLDTVSIVGMPGLGKTTLAKMIYNDNYVANYFYIRAWCCISQTYNRRQLLLVILSQVTKISNRVTDTMSDGDLADKLRKCLIRKRYLIVIDDIWTIEAWDDLSGCFPDDDYGSRILFTSRLQHVASQVNCDGVHLLRFLSKEECWELLQLKIFPKESCPLEELIEIGFIIAEKCQGLPLFVVLVAGLLSKIERSRDCWEKFEVNLSSKQLMDIVDMSYQNLPHHLKPCFLYLGVFLEDKKIPASQLKWLWIAEGLVQKSLTESLEDVAEHYLMELVSRSLVLVSERRLTRGIKACRVHDLLRDFCLEKSKEENFLEWIYESHGSHDIQIYGQDWGADPHHPFSSDLKSYHQRRLCVYTKRNKFILSRPSDYLRCWI